MPVANKISTFLFFIIVAGALASEWTLFIKNLYLLAPSIILLIISMLAIGYNSALWFKMNSKTAVTIAIESAVQNATVGIAIGNIIATKEVGISVFSLPSGVYGIVMYMICIPFVIWFLKKT